MINNYQDSFIKLVGLTTFLEQQTSLDDSLNELAAMSANILDVQNCSIMLFQNEETTKDFRLRVFAKFGPLPSIAYHEAVKVNEGIAGRVAASGQPLLVQDITKSPFLPLARRPGEPNKCFVVVPIVIGCKVIGIINFSNPSYDRCLDLDDLNQANFVALLVGKSIQVVQLQNILKSNFLQYSIARETKNLVNNSITAISKDPGKLAKIVAKTFYRELTKAGFETRHIIAAATEIITLLNLTLNKHKKRLEDAEHRHAQ
jgi:signal transduction protein with GAF and PtsI domain